MRRRPAWPVLLITPRGEVWVTGEPKRGDQPIVIVVDVLEESLRTFETPALLLPDRQAFLQTKIMQDVASSGLWSLWVSSRAPWPHRVHASLWSIVSPRVQQVLEGYLAQQRPIVGVWTLSSLLLRQAWRRAPQKGGFQLWAFQAGHGTRLLLLHGRQPVFTRLIPVDAQHNIAEELAATQQFLRDHGVVPRAEPVTVHLLDSQEALLRAAGPAARDWRVHADAAVHLEMLLAYARPGLPGQLASAVERRFYLARLARRACHVAGGVVLLGGLGMAGALGQEMALLRADQTKEQQSIASLAQQRRVMADELHATGVSVHVLRLALQLPHLRPENTQSSLMDMARTIARTQQWLADAPAELVVKQWQWKSRQACTPTAQEMVQGGASVPSPAAGASSGTGPSLSLELDLSRIDPASQRERWVERLDGRLKADPEWEVVSSPLLVRSQRALRVGGSDVQERGDNAVWCLDWRSADASLPLQDGRSRP